MSGINFWYCEMSPHCRAVKMTAAALDIKFEKITRVLISKEEHKTTEFLKMNPQHLLPTIQEGKFTLWQSRAIMRYLVAKSSSPDAKFLYPDDAQERAMVDQWLDFDACNIIPAWGKFAWPIIYGGEKPDKSNLKKFHEELSTLNTHLAGREFVASTRHPTLADLSLAASISSSQCFTSDIIADVASGYPNIGAWLKKVKDLSYYKENQDGIVEFRKFVDDRLATKSEDAPTSKPE